jgi:tRNA1Val (adenine37-N6)-methyltransferase
MSDTHEEPAPSPQSTTTLDAMFHGQLALEQSRTGYRFSVDAILLAHRVAAHAPKTCLEIGPGCGIVAIAAVWLQPSIQRCVAVEVQPALAALTRSNVQRNGLSERIEVIEGDVRQCRKRITGGPFDVVFINPPYFRPTHGRVNPDGERAAARHQIHGTLDDLLREARLHAGHHGVIELVMPASELGELLQSLEKLGLRRQQIRILHPRDGAPGELAMVAARQGRAWKTTFEPPMVMYRPDGTYTDELTRMLAGRTTNGEEV